MTTVRAKLVYLLPGVFRHRHGEEVLYAWDQEVHRVAGTSRGQRLHHDILLFWDFAKTFLREWRIALPWELKTAPFIVAIILGYQFAWHDWFRLGIAAVICAGYGASYLICKTGFDGSIRRKVGYGFGLAVLGALTASAPYLLYPFIRRDDSLTNVDILGFVLVGGLLMLHALQNGRWGTCSRAGQKTIEKEGVASWVAVVIGAGLPMFFLLKLHELRFLPHCPFWLLMGAVHVQKIWADTENFIDVSTYVYPQGRR